MSANESAEAPADALPAGLQPAANISRAPSRASLRIAQRKNNSHLSDSASASPAASAPASAEPSASEAELDEHQARGRTLSSASTRVAKRSRAEARPTMNLREAVSCRLHTGHCSLQSHKFYLPPRLTTRRRQGSAWTSRVMNGTYASSNSKCNGR